MDCVVKFKLAEILKYPQLMYYEQALVIGKEIKDPKLINFCEENLKSIKS